MEEVVIINGARTPIGKFGGVFKDVPAVDLASFAMKAAIERSGVTLDMVDDVIMGAIHQEGMGNNPARIASLKAGISFHSGALTVNNICSSSMKAIEIAANQIMMEQDEIILAGGMESNSQCPYMLMNLRWGYRLRSDEIVDALFYDGFTDVHGIYGGYNHVGETAENIIENAEEISKKYDLPLISLSFAEINQYALESQKKYQNARERDFFKEIIPINISSRGKEEFIQEDESPRPYITIDALNRLKPVFREGGMVTAGNTPNLNDGAVALILMSKSKARDLNLNPLGEWKCSASGNVEPEYMGLGPIPAVRNLLNKTQLTLPDIDVFEINEAQAQQVLFCIRALGIDEDKVNVNGGAIAMGHPPGMTGGRLILTALQELNQKNKKRAICTLCAGGGTGMATLIENPNYRSS
ncbi:MAG: thiolase family protein [Promethearchaeota archaeon]|nr:MAG: thiolase family protein [Candidatus Lokiarchaeota archaeon]